jgi:hypothetical protein
MGREDKMDAADAAGEELPCMWIHRQNGVWAVTLMLIFFTLRGMDPYIGQGIIIRLDVAVRQFHHERGSSAYTPSNWSRLLTQGHLLRGVSSSLYTS